MQNLLPIIENIERSLNQLKKGILALSPQIGSDSILQNQEIKRLLATTNWPEAINLESLCVSDDDKKERANGILDMLQIYGLDPQNKKCLDYGCGEGHLVQAMARTASLSVGYDLKDDWNKITKNTYDIVILYDVLDHAEQDTPTEILEKIKSVIHKDSLVFIHFHPWCSKHGAHLYRFVNKAYIQLFFNKEELKAMGCVLIPSEEIIYPIRTYKQWIKDAGFKTLENEIHQSPVPELFLQKPLYFMLEKIWGPKPTLEQMAIEFADVVIKLEQS